MAINYSKYINSKTTHYIANSGSDENKEYHGGKAGDLLWIPDQETATEGLAEFCLRTQIYSLLLRGATGVQGATLVSMRSAYDNGTKSAAALETAINRQRQTQVTSGVIETSSGYGPWREG